MQRERERFEREVRDGFTRFFTPPMIGPKPP
jgi:hypothetical protein